MLRSTCGKFKVRTSASTAAASYRSILPPRFLPVPPHYYSYYYDYYYSRRILITLPSSRKMSSSSEIIPIFTENSSPPAGPYQLMTWGVFFSSITEPSCKGQRADLRVWPDPRWSIGEAGRRQYRREDCGLLQEHFCHSAGRWVERFEDRQVDCIPHWHGQLRRNECYLWTILRAQACPRLCCSSPVAQGRASWDWLCGAAIACIYKIRGQKAFGIGSFQTAQRVVKLRSRLYCRGSCCYCYKNHWVKIEWSSLCIIYQWLVLLLSEFPVLRATGLGSGPLMHGAIQKG